MSRINPLREAIEACRPGHRDLELPEMAELREQLALDAELRAMYEWTQQADAAVAQAFRRVEVPEGLEDRLLATLDAASKARDTSSDPDGVELAEPVQQERDQRENAPANRRGTRRWWIAAALAVAASLAIIASLWLPTQTPSHSELARWAESWTLRTLELSGQDDWQPFDERQFPTLPWRNTRWRTIRTQLDARTVVFDFPTREGQHLLVYRIRTTRDLKLPAVPYQPLTTTGKWRVAGWQESQFAYIVVTNEPRLLDGFRAGLAYHARAQAARRV